jgi:hypothetical protein
VGDQLSISMETTEENIKNCKRGCDFDCRLSNSANKELCLSNEGTSE